MQQLARLLRVHRACTEIKQCARAESRIPAGSDARDEDIARRPDQRTGLLQRILAGSRQRLDCPLHFGWLPDNVLHETGGCGHACPSSAMQYGRDVARLHAAKNGEQQSGRIGEKRVTAVRALYETGSRNRVF